jgi:hypothetical protein
MLKKDWKAWVVLLIFTLWTVSIFAELGIATSILSVVGLIAIYLLCTHVFKLNKSGPIPWYGSPIIWVVIPLLVAFLIYYGLN